MEEPQKVTRSVTGYHSSEETLNLRFGAMPRAERSAAEETGSDLLSGVEEEPFPKARYHTPIQLERSPAWRVARQGPASRMTPDLKMKLQAMPLSARRLPDLKCRSWIAR